MKLKSITLSAVACAAAMIALSLAVPGCEKAKGLGGLTVTPSSVVLTTSSNMVQFTVVLDTNSTVNLMSLPLSWSVSDPSLGAIVASSGLQALYQRTDKDGNNIVTARDQMKNEGYATVQQITEQYSLTLAASPNPIPVGTNTSTVTVAGGIEPYKWDVLDHSKGKIVSSGSGTAIYQSSEPGVGVVQVEDANEIAGTIAINQL